MSRPETAGYDRRMPTAPRPSPRGSVPAGVWTVLAWSGLVLSPVALVLWMLFADAFSAVPFLAMALPFGVLRRRPWVALGVLLAEVVVAELVMPWPEASASGV